MKASFQNAIDKASSQQVAATLDAAITAATEEEQRKSHEELLRVRKGIQKVLERERLLMKEQETSASGDRAGERMGGEAAAGAVVDAGEAVVGGGGEYW